MSAPSSATAPRCVAAPRATTAVGSSRVDRRASARAHCPRCGAELHLRKPNSLQRTWALVIAAAICYVPANVLPVMTVTSLGKPVSDTIMSGVVYFVEHGDWPLALVIFTASVFVPDDEARRSCSSCSSPCSRRSSWRPVERTRMYRLTEAIGRWSMVDIYVITIMVALVRLGNLATIEASAGAVFFGAVVVITIFAAESFDPRMIWDRSDPETR